MLFRSRTSRPGEPFSRAHFLIANHALTSGKPTWGEVHPTAPLLACPAGADDLQLTPSPAKNASPVGLSNRNGKFVNIIAIAFSINGLEKFIRILGKPYLHRWDTKSLKLSILVSGLVKGQTARVERKNSIVLSSHRTGTPHSVFRITV